MTIRVVGVAGSSSPASRSRLLVARTLAHLESLGARSSLIDLLELPADALLGRRKDPLVDGAIGEAASADALVLGTPVYRAAYSGQLKAFLDLFPQDALAGRAVGIVVTGYTDTHYLAVDHSLRPLVASLKGTTAARAVYVIDAALPDKTVVPDAVDRQTRSLAVELQQLATALKAARVAE